MIVYIDNLDLLFQKIHHHASIDSSLTKSEQPYQPSIRESWDHLYNLAAKVAKNQNKQVEFIASGLNDYPLSDSMKDYINTIATQFIRNSIVHGIEKSTDRLKAGKPEIGSVAVNLSKASNGDFTLRFTDDGAGLDGDKILAKAIDTNLITEEKAKTLSASKIYNLIFHPKFSTSESADEDHGHGVGMALVKQKTKQAKATISISTNNTRTIFTVVTPAAVS